MNVTFHSHGVTQNVLDIYIKMHLKCTLYQNALCMFMDNNFFILFVQHHLSTPRFVTGSNSNEARKHGRPLTTGFEAASLA
mmetsp:Transcript_20672/g.57020  ORF Transcript_20672/g.57020 Transcript_20672/m.57020 type:complete len:81 (+) Transcript_20672:39-281(+)